MQEIWESCIECPFLEVSNMGRVRKKDVYSEVLTKWGGRTLRHDKAKMLTPLDNGNGYRYVSFRTNNKRQNYYVHRLVARAFLDGYEEGLVVDHINHDKADNRAVNLEWVSQKENVQRSVPNMKKPKSICRPSNTGEKYITYTRCKGKMAYKVRGGNYFSTLEEAVKYRNEVIGW